ncbi:alpha/beta fold hydrolase [Rhizobium rosettiformans]|uniref:Alpha/beta fold hydrolase n=1 Tax=Rhizobium rosettiformans TaxID=1368430 RepID=A0ABX7EXK1_9HYPH|nr:alpha/beta fold hydrolase [Rhizobium rosettiformans]QRF52839.1 alpha/beta fold hydrolase [Rhizobium rosettiformans]
MRIVMGLSLALVLISIAATVFLYLRPPVLTLEREAKIGADAPLDSLDVLIADSESEAGRIREGLAKQIVWADPARKSKTPVSVIYVHGFSASPAEVRPLPDRVAQALGANLFLTRLTGHGLDDPDALGLATIDDWAADVGEALAIGKRLGDRVVVVSTSTGASLVTWALGRPSLTGKIAASVFLSPNYGVQASGSFLLTGPFGGSLARLIIGERTGFDPISPLNAHNWTTNYPVTALIPMAQSVRLASHTPVEEIRVPALFLQSVEDKVVRPERTAAVAARWGADHALVDPGPTGDANNHVIAGDTYSPETTEPIAKIILDWLAGQGIR